MIDRNGQLEFRNSSSRSRVFDELRRMRSISRATLARNTGLSRATISIMADELLATGVAVETGFGASTGGRPPVMLQFQPDAALAIGARMRDHEWGIAVTDLDAVIQHELTVSVDGNTPEDSVRALKAGVLAIRKHVDNQKVLPAIGLGTPGLVDMRFWRDQDSRGCRLVRCAN